MTLSIPPSGPSPSRLLIVGESASADDLWKQRPFAGRSGEELDKMLHEAGIIVTEARRTYVLPFKLTFPLDAWIESGKKKAKDKGLYNVWGEQYYSDDLKPHLETFFDEIRATRPEIILALGDLPLWALTGESGVSTWRGSFLDPHPEVAHKLGYSPIIIPAHPPATVQRMWEWRSITVRDFTRVKDYLENPSDYQYPAYLFSIRPTLPGVMQTLQALLRDCRAGTTVKLAIDIETICRHIACIGIAWNAREALCIPIMDEGATHYWTADEETAIVLAFRELVTHPNCYVIGQNFNYDAQHFAKHHGYYCNLKFDTMLAQHVLYPGTQKSLDYLSSMYAHYHRYWKDELDDYHKMPQDLHKFWTYNCKDCVITWEMESVLSGLLTQANMWEQYNFQMRMARHAFNTMLRGVKINAKARSEVAGELMEAIAVREQLIHTLAGEPLNVASPKQMQTFFYESLAIPPIFSRKTKRPTLDDDALDTISKKYPLLKPFIDIIREKRSLGVFLSTFCMMPLDSDGRMRTSYNIAGTETFRFNSGENAFGNGGNLQNIPKGEDA